MKLSQDRILFLARESLTRLRDEKLVEIANFAQALRAGREVLEQFAELGDAVDEMARRKIASLKRGVLEGTVSGTSSIGATATKNCAKRAPPANAGAS